MASKATLMEAQMATVRAVTAMRFAMVGVLLLEET